jgi:uncharacterized protein (DUF2249 family)
LISFKDSAGARRDHRHERQKTARGRMLATPIQSDAPPVYAFDARGVARRLRAPAIAAALDALRIGETLRVTTDADAQPLLDHVQARYASRLSWHFVERDGERVVIDFARV